MPSPSEKLADSLEVLKDLQDKDVVAVRSSDLTRTHRERLVKGGFLQEVMKGWYVPARHDQPAGKGTAWYTCFWGFCAAYLTERFGDQWCLSPEQSLLLHVGDRTVPSQLLVHAPKGDNKPVELLHGTSLLPFRYAKPEESLIETTTEGLRLVSLPAALVSCGARFYAQNPTEARAALALIRDASDVLAVLLAGGHSTIAGRLAGAFRNIERHRIADQILETMRDAGYDVRETDPFDARTPAIALEGSPYVNRIRLMWQHMREIAATRFPPAPGLPKDSAAYLAEVDEVYVDDAYHSLSIEGYRVSPDLIERVRSNQWNPDGDDADSETRNALAARGYHEAFQQVRQSVRSVLAGENAGDVAHSDHGGWYRALWSPSVTAGVVAPADLAGYRSDQVYISRSMHVPPPREAVRDLMPELFDLLRNETDAAVRAVLGHFVFVYIHPYMDGNGRIGRFLMNLMLASGGYSWTVIPVDRRDEYMAALESASVGQDIGAFADFLGELVGGQ